MKSVRRRIREAIAPCTRGRVQGCAGIRNRAERILSALAVAESEQPFSFFDGVFRLNLRELEHILVWMRDHGERLTSGNIARVLFTAQFRG